MAGLSSWRLYCAFDVHGDPKGQPRPRAFSFHGKGRVYNPDSADTWKGRIALAAIMHLPEKPLDVPVRVALAFYFQRPGRLDRKAAPEGLVAHMAKPDCDNLAKAALDCLTDIGMWKDDAQVCSLVVDKYYAARDQASGALVQVFTLKEDLNDLSML
jgi:Holliday junction resolvase RusA-like endonuclease